MKKENKSNYLDPAKSIIEMFGGITATSKIVERHPTRIAKWRKAKPEGTGGDVPRDALKLLAKEAARIGKSMEFAGLILKGLENVE